MHLTERKKAGLTPPSRLAFLTAASALALKLLHDEHLLPVNSCHFSI
jgi:hypothetical protein